MHITDISRMEGAFFPAGVEKISYQSSIDTYSDWALALPPKRGKTWLVVIHGHGSHGDQLYTRQDIRTWWLTRFLEGGYGILTPNLRNNAWMSYAAIHDLDDLIELCRSHYGAERFLFIGGSMGGTSNLVYACQRPQNVDGVAVLGAAVDFVSYLDFCRRGQSQTPVLKEIADAIETNVGGDTVRAACNYQMLSPIYHTASLSGIPVFYAQGSHDLLMPVADARRFAAAMAHHSDFSYVEIPGGNHDSPIPLGCLPENAAIQPLKWIDRLA